MNLAEQRSQQEKDAQASVPFPALVHGQEVVVTAVLERTAVVGNRDGSEKRVIRLDLVEPTEEVRWYPPDRVARSRHRGQEISIRTHRGQAPPGNLRRRASA